MGGTRLVRGLRPGGEGEGGGGLAAARPGVQDLRPQEGRDQTRSRLADVREEEGRGDVVGAEGELAPDERPGEAEVDLVAGDHLGGVLAPGDDLANVAGGYREAGGLGVGR